MVEIANKFTDLDWEKLENELKADFTNTDLWNKAIGVFESRLCERYILPAENIQKITGKAMAENNPGVTIGLVPCAVGGTSLSRCITCLSVTGRVIVFFLPRPMVWITSPARAAKGGMTSCP